jgi:hypothetical protein
MFKSSHLSPMVWVLVGLAVCVVPGCGDANAPDTVPVSGVVQYQGKPLEGATVIFSTQGADAQSTLLAVGKTNADGQFQVKTQMGATGSYDGAVPGTHRVTVSKFIPPNGLSDAEYQKLLDAEAQIMATKGQLGPGEAAPAKVQLLRPEYSNSQKTTLTAEVKADGKNEFVFEVK